MDGWRFNPVTHRNHETGQHGRTLPDLRAEPLDFIVDILTHFTLTFAIAKFRLYSRNLETWNFFSLLATPILFHILGPRSICHSEILIARLEDRSFVSQFPRVWMSMGFWNEPFLNADLSKKSCCESEAVLLKEDESNSACSWEPQMISMPAAAADDVVIIVQDACDVTSAWPSCLFLKNKTKKTTTLTWKTAGSSALTREKFRKNGMRSFSSVRSYDLNMFFFSCHNGPIDVSAAPAWRASALA